VEDLVTYIPRCMGEHSMIIECSPIHLGMYVTKGYELSRAGNPAYRLRGLLRGGPGAYFCKAPRRRTQVFETHPIRLVEVSESTLYRLNYMFFGTSSRRNLKLAMPGTVFAAGDSLSRSIPQGVY
jgi:hypothetical protein